VAVNVGGLDAVVLPQLAEQHGEADEVVVEADVELIFFGVEVEVGQEVELHFFLNRDLLLLQSDHIRLEHHELGF